MLKIAGWIISHDAIDSWKLRAKAFETQSAVTIWTRAVETLEERNHKGLKPLPITEADFISTSWPKTTKEARGKYVCILVRLKEDAKSETWDNFTPIPPVSNEDEIFTALESDGLKLGEWVPPFEAEWTFGRRYPGARYPPEPPRGPKGFKIRPGHSHNRFSKSVKLVKAPDNQLNDGHASEYNIGSRI